MLNLLLVPLDTSAFAEQALPHAVLLARRAQAKLRLVCVRATLPLEFTGEDEVEQYLGRIAAQLEPELPGAVSYAVLTDEWGPLQYAPPASNAVADLISRHAREQNVDLIAMATHGHGGARRAWLGSVADSLIRISSRPVLLIRPTDESFGSAIRADHGIQHIVIALDGSETAEQVIQYALAVGRPFAARYSLLRVLTPLAWGPYEPLAAPPPPMSRQAVVQYLEHIATSMREQGSAVATRIVEGFSPGPAIVEYAETHAADVIAVSTEGAGRVRRLLLGSVTDKVVRSSDVPVLVCNIRHSVRTAEHDEMAATVAATSG